jgi:hypothetical protein
LKAKLSNLVDKDHKRYWFHRFGYAMKQIPRFLPTGIACKQDLRESATDEYINNKSFEGASYGIFSIQCEGHEVTKRIHQLAVIMSLLGSETTSLQDYVRVGHSDYNVTIPFTKFCYHILNGKETTLLNTDDLPLESIQSYLEFCKEDTFLYPPSSPLLKVNKGGLLQYNKEDDEDEQDFDSEEDVLEEEDDDVEDIYIEEEESSRTLLKGNRHELSIGVSPNIEGSFEPFVYFCDMDGSSTSSRSFRKWNVEDLGHLKDYQECYLWKTDERGWAPSMYSIYSHCLTHFLFRIL